MPEFCNNDFRIQSLPAQADTCTQLSCSCTTKPMLRAAIMSLPAAVRRLLARVTPFVHADGLPVVRPVCSPLRLLIVDDEASVRSALTSLLRAIGHHARSADSGADALVLLRQEPFDLMLCDVRMPGMSGLELVPQAMRIDRDLAVLMLTGVNEIETATEALAAGAKDYLVKPIELAELEAALSRAALRRQLEVDRRHADAFAREERAPRLRGFDPRLLPT